MTLRSIKIFIVSILVSSSCNALPSENQNSYIRINKSTYSLDKDLIKNGYKLKNVNDQGVLMFKNEVVPIVGALPVIDPDEAIKLYIELENTIVDAVVYLNDTALPQRTDKSGAAYIDLYRVKGKYHLKIENTTNPVTHNFYFDLDRPLKLHCDTKKDLFDCKKIYY